MEPNRIAQHEWAPSNTRTRTRTIFVAASTINRDGIVAAAVDTDAKKEEEAAQLRKHTSHPEQVTRQRVWRDSLKLMYI